jgi:hypothetical protein
MYLKFTEGGVASEPPSVARTWPRLHQPPARVGRASRSLDVGWLHSSLRGDQLTLALRQINAHPFNSPHTLQKTRRRR